MRLDERQVEAWQDLQKALRPEDRHSPWISKLMRENRSMLVSLWMGFNRDVFDQCRTCADFLNKVTESCPALESITSKALDRG